MSYQKLFRKNNGVGKCMVQIHADHYNCSFEHILKMVNELRKDFSISDRDIQVHKYGGERKKGMTFVEALLPDDTKMPEGYEEIK